LQKGNALYGRCLQNAVFGWRSQTPFGAQLCGVCGAPTGVFGAFLRVCGALLRVCGAVKLHLTIYSFPEVKNTVRFTTEPAHMRMQTVSVGVVTKQPESACSAFLRPMKDNLMPAHVHTLVPLYTLEKELPDTR